MIKHSYQPNMWITSANGRSGPYYCSIGFGSLDYERMKAEYRYAPHGQDTSFLTFAEASAHVNSYWRDPVKREAEGWL